MVVDFEGANAGVLISTCRTQRQTHVTFKLETLAAQAYIGSGSGEGDQMSKIKMRRIDKVQVGIYDTDRCR